MKRIPALVWLPAVFILGGLVGYYGPSEELRAKETRAKEEKAKPRQADAFGSFAQMVNIPSEASRPRRRPVPKTESTEESPSTNAAPEAAKVEFRRHHENISPEDLRARIDEAADLWRARVEMARAAAIEKLGLDDEGAKAFNAAVESMNDKLRDSMQAVADEVASAKAMTPELGIRLMGDLSTSLAEAYDDIGACVGEDMRDDVSNLQLVEFIDPSVGEPLIAVQDKIYPQSSGESR